MYIYSQIRTRTFPPAVRLPHKNQVVNTNTNVFNFYMYSRSRRSSPSTPTPDCSLRGTASRRFIPLARTIGTSKATTAWTRSLHELRKLLSSARNTRNRNGIICLQQQMPELTSSPDSMSPHGTATLGRTHSRHRDAPYSHLGTIRRDHTLSDAIPGPESCV